MRISKQTILEVIISAENRDELISKIFLAEYNKKLPTQEAPEEKTPQLFNVILNNTGEAKLQVVKCIKELTGLGLKEAKHIVDLAPSLIKENLTAEEADIICTSLFEHGASCLKTKMI